MPFCLNLAPVYLKLLKITTNGLLMKQLILSTAISFLILNNTHAQDACKVSLQALAGKYEGGCKDGKASGEGKAEGVDRYQGNFKNGFPDGEGDYTWANKDHYVGSFRKGQLEGKGEMHYATRSGRDSVVAGFWKKNKYVGIYENPYVVRDRTSKVNKVDVQIIQRAKGGGSININSSQLTGAAGATPIIPLVTDITVLAGQYVNKNIQSMSKSGIARITQLIFPFRARFQFSNGEMVEILFNEDVDYEVTIAFN